MKNLKIVLVVVMSLLVSFEAFAESKEVEPSLTEQVEVNREQRGGEYTADEGAFAEDISIDITSEDLDSALEDAYAIR